MHHCETTNIGENALIIIVMATIIINVTEEVKVLLCCGRSCEGGDRLLNMLEVAQKESYLGYGSNIHNMKYT